jgi:hypothetical protein
MDIQRYLDNYFTSKDMPFIVGTKGIQNLFNNSDILQSKKIHFFCDPILRKPVINKFGQQTKLVATTSYCIAVTSTMDMPYFNEKNTDNAGSKFTLNIEPLIEVMNTIVKELSCFGYDITFDYVDVTNVKSVNFDGLIGSISFSKDI